MSDFNDKQIAGSRGKAPAQANDGKLEISATLTAAPLTQVTGSQSPLPLAQEALTGITLVKEQGKPETFPAAPNTLGAGVLDLPAANTGYALPAASGTVRGVLVQAAKANSGIVKIGNVTTRSYELEAGEAVAVLIDDTTKVYAESSSAGDDVNWLILSTVTP
jgi:hypothetical protein